MGACLGLPAERVHSGLTRWPYLAVLRAKVLTSPPPSPALASPFVPSSTPLGCAPVVSVSTCPTLAVPRGYQCGLDVHGVRRDQQERPELRHGSVDFAAPSTFNNRATPQAPIHVFLVDVSYNAVANGSLEVR